MDNLPNDPPNSGNGIPPFGSHFDPHSNPVDPNNPYASIPQSPQEPSHESVHSDVAQHRPRDAHGHFLPYEYPTEPQVIHNSQATQNSQTVLPNNPNLSAPSNSPSSPKPSDDAPLFEAKVNNPFSSFFNWIKRLIKNEGINIKIKPLTAIAMVVALTGGGGIIGGIVGYAFPHSSPILHRSVIYQGQLQRTNNGFILTLPNSDLYTLKPKMDSHTNFQSLTNGPALVKGNLTKEDYVIEVSEIILLGTNIPPATSSAQSKY